MTGSGDWQPLPGAVLSDAAFKAMLNCNGSRSGEKWQVDVGAPGYAVASNVYCFGHPPDALFGGRPGFGGPMGPPCTEHAS
jgi:hypothetical protein